MMAHAFSLNGLDFTLLLFVITRLRCVLIFRKITIIKSIETEGEKKKNRAQEKNVSKERVGDSEDERT